MTITPQTSGASPSGPLLWWKRHRKVIVPPILGILGFLLAWQLSASLGLTKLPGPLSLFTE